MARIVVGADVCQGSWAAIHLVDGLFDGGAVLPTLSEVARTFGKDASTIAVDIPLSYALPGTKGRMCEREGRAMLGPRRSSMFDTYPQAILEAPSHGLANTLSQKTVGCGIPQQSFGLRNAIAEAISLSAEDPRIHETHPELVFSNLAGPLASKKSWTGFRQRLKALENVGILLPIEFPEMDHAAMDDVIDAAAAAFAADRISQGIGQRVPSLGSDESFIWF